MIREASERDDWGEVFHALNVRCRLSYEDIAGLTWAQLLNALHQGRPPRPGAVKWDTGAR